MAIADAYRRERGRMPHAPARQAGNWKLAYADFLTALVALFLVLWLVNDRAASDKVALADYFRGEQEFRPPEGLPSLNSQVQNVANGLNTTARLEGYRDNLSARAQDTHVRIDLMDRHRSPMFISGEATLTEDGVNVLSALAEVLEVLPGRFEIEGHTDAFPSAGANGDNWTLSLGRADAARRVLVAAGIEPSRISHIAGFGDTRPLRAEEPHRAENRRVTIVLQVTE